MNKTLRKWGFIMMKVEVSQKDIEVKVQVGDFARIGSNYYIISNDSEGFIARNINGHSGYSGYWDSIENLVGSFATNYQIFSQDLYKIILGRIED